MLDHEKFECTLPIAIITFDFQNSPNELTVLPFNELHTGNKVKQILKDLE